MCFSETREAYKRKEEKRLSTFRALELVDFATDIGSFIIIRDDVSLMWKVILGVSLIITLILNVIIQFYLRKGCSWKKRKQRIAISFALMGAEDMIVVPINIAYLNKEIENGLDPIQETVETVAVGMSTVLGAILLLYRSFILLHHISCSLPNEVGETPENLFPPVETPGQANQLTSTSPGWHETDYRHQLPVSNVDSRYQGEVRILNRLPPGLYNSTDQVDENRMDLWTF